MIDQTMTIEEAIKQTQQLPALPYNEYPPMAKENNSTLNGPFEPVKVFDQIYWVGSKAVGGILIDTGDGYILIDQGSNIDEAKYMADSITKLGLDPSLIKLLVVSHEHFDHYGGTQYFKDHVCKEAKVAISRVAWNLLQTIPTEFAYMEPRVKQYDILLTDGMHINLGKTNLYVVSTPGHSPGCMSFIFNATYQGKELMVGMMGGSAVWPNMSETRLYQNSIEYFKLYTDLFKCNAFTAVHQPLEAIEAVRKAWDNSEHPWICKPETYSEKYLQQFRDKAHHALLSDGMQRYLRGIRPDGSAIDEGSPIVEREE